MVRKSRCTETTDGIINNVKLKGQDFPTVITVEYVVEEKCYHIQESVKLKSEIIKLGFLPIGQRKSPRLGDTSVGRAVRVIYNPNNPEEAYLPENIGHINT